MVLGLINVACDLKGNSCCCEVHYVAQLVRSSVRLIFVRVLIEAHTHQATITINFYVFYYVQLRYCRTLPNLPTHSDGCGAEFSMAQKEDKSSNAMTKSSLSLRPCLPRIDPGRRAEPTEGRGDLLIRNIWKHQTDCILDVHITNLDAPRSPAFP